MVLHSKIDSQSSHKRKTQEWCEMLKRKTKPDKKHEQVTTVSLPDSHKDNILRRSSGLLSSWQCSWKTLYHDSPYVHSPHKWFAASFSAQLQQTTELLQQPMARQSSRSRSPRINMYVESSCVVVHPPMPGHHHHDLHNKTKDEQAQMPVPPKSKPQDQETDWVRPPWTNSIDNVCPPNTVMYLWNNIQYPTGYWWTWQKWSKRYWTLYNEIWWTPYVHYDNDGNPYIYWHSAKKWCECMQQ